MSGRVRDEGAPATGDHRGDVAAWLRTGRCRCGRTSPRLGPIIGRVDHQLKVYGQTVHPDLLLDIADRCPAVHRSAVCVTHDPVSGDHVTLLLVPAPHADPGAARGGYTFGLKRVEILSAQANGITLLVLAAWLAWEALRRLIAPPAVTGGLVLVTALVGSRSTS